MRKKRYQKGGIKRVGPSWVGQWWENGHRRNRTLGRVSEMTKTEAKRILAEILIPINSPTPATEPSPDVQFGPFVEKVFLPFYSRKWKESTRRTNVDRLAYHLTSRYESLKLKEFRRDELQDFLDEKAKSGLSFSIVDHLRWDLKQIFDMAVNEGYLERNPAKLLFTPREAHRPPKRRMTREQVEVLFSRLKLRERLICMLAILAGLRPGEIFALQWKHVGEDYLDIRQRVYKGKLDTPKTNHSIRKVALSEGLRSILNEWRARAVNDQPDGWLFPSETLKTPVIRDNCWRRHIAPRLGEDLGWVNFHVMRRTRSSLMQELDVDPKIVAEQLGYTLDVNLNIYTDAGFQLRKKAVNILEASLRSSDEVAMEYVN